ncbi:MAG: hypothetical protein FRX49_13230 [Trebouxia sp. A1-2]|nr:MAG: hypothetical protein FRX49_13230 [Trebouxia sp. A1-2]
MGQGNYKYLSRRHYLRLLCDKSAARTSCQAFLPGKGQQCHVICCTLILVTDYTSKQDRAALFAVCFGDLNNLQEGLYTLLVYCYKENKHCCQHQKQQTALYQEHGHMDKIAFQDKQQPGSITAPPC